MTVPSRVAFDTNVIISAVLLENSIPSQAVQQAEARGSVLYSEATLAELARVLLRPKFARYIAPEQVDGLLARIQRTWQNVTITHRIHACRDPFDDMFLELAVNGQATALITGDHDLLALGPFYRGIAIVTPGAYLASSD